jgi:hypothetical protein
VNQEILASEERANIVQFTSQIEVGDGNLGA